MPIPLSGLVVLLAGQKAAAPPPEGYQTPPAPIAEAAMTPWWRNVTAISTSPDGARGLIVERDGPPPLARLGSPYRNLGGLQIELGGLRERGVYVRSAAGLRLMDLATRRETPVRLPEGARVSDPSWSPDGAWVAFLLHRPDRSLVYVAEAKTGRARPLTETPALPTLVTGLDWTRDGRVVAVLRPENLRALPAEPAVATTPRIEETAGKKASLVTFASLLRTPNDRDALRAATTGQLALISLDGRTRRVGSPRPWERVEFSPDGRAFVGTVMTEPFSNVVPVSRFGERRAVFDADGKELALLQETKVRLEEEDAPKPKPEDRRNLAWRPDGAGLVFLRQGPEDKEKKRKDRAVLWKFPFGEKDEETLWESDARLSRATYDEGARRLFLDSTEGGKRRVQMVQDGKATTLLEAKPDDEGFEWGELATRDGFVRTTQDSAYLLGAKNPKDWTKEPARPWVDRLSLADCKRTRLFFAAATPTERASLVGDGGTLLVTRESPVSPPDLFLRTGVTEVRLTSNRDYAPDLSQARREFVPITRADGFRFWARVTLPAGATAKSPAFFWFYPGEVKDQTAYDKAYRPAGKFTFSPVGGGNKAILLRAGYVVVEPDCPIVGPEGRQNDGYVFQLRNNLAATIDELSGRGYFDRSRIGLGGHSYGAFSTVNAMVHTPFFRCGIAGDGNFNRTLTPFGFQNEERKLWEGRDVYLSMSPILYADQLTGALLLYHGQDDQNVGTSPINADRLFAVLESLGKPAQLVTYPYEDHGQIARETILDQWSRWVAWLDRWLK